MHGHDDCTVKVNGSERTIILRGEWDLSRVGELERAFKRALTGEGRLRVTVDLTAATYADTTVMSRLMQLNRTLTWRRSLLIVRCRPGAVHRAISASRLPALVHVRIVSERARSSREATLR